VPRESSLKHEGGLVGHEHEMLKLAHGYLLTGNYRAGLLLSHLHVLQMVTVITKRERQVQSRFPPGWSWRLMDGGNKLQRVDKGESLSGDSPGTEFSHSTFINFANEFGRQGYI